MSFTKALVDLACHLIPIGKSSLRILAISRILSITRIGYNLDFRLVLETLVRLCTRDDNVDMILATRPYSRLQRVIRLLFENVQQVCKNLNLRKLTRLVQDYCQILKELSITLLKQLILPQSPLTQYAAKIENSVKSLILFIENQTPVSWKIFLLYQFLGFVLNPLFRILQFTRVG